MGSAASAGTPNADYALPVDEELDAAERRITASSDACQRRRSAVMLEQVVGQDRFPAPALLSCGSATACPADKKPSVVKPGAAPGK